MALIKLVSVIIRQLNLTELLFLLLLQMKKTGRANCILGDASYEAVTISTDKIKFLGKLIAYRSPDKYSYHNFVDEDEFECGYGYYYEDE